MRTIRKGAKLFQSSRTRRMPMHNEAGDHATLKRHQERLEALYADLERSPSMQTISAMLGVCAAVRWVDNLLYRYAIEQLIWIEV